MTRNTTQYPASSSSPHLVFLVGLYRSGTSLLYSLLNQHPQLALMYECDVWNFPDAWAGLRLRGNWLERQEFYNRSLSRHRLVFGDSLRGLESLRRPEDLYRTFSQGKGAAWSGEKSPLYCDRLRQLARQYPGCSFILLWRDPVEVHESVLRAGVTEDTFRRRGMLSRLIFYQEQMIRQADVLARQGVRIHHVTYADLIGRTEPVCRGICEFLKLDFDPAMLDLAHADFSAIHGGVHHAHLRRGVIARRQFAEQLAPSATVRKLQRFRARWDRLRGAPSTSTAPDREPSRLEHLYHQCAGRWWTFFDGAKRVMREFLPLAWLQAYRELRRPAAAAGGISAIKPTPLLKQFFVQWFTVLAAAGLLALTAVMDYVSGPNVTLAPFYMVPAALLTLVINRRAGTVTAALCAATWSFMQESRIQSLTPGVLAWNCLMRFLLLETIVLLLARGRTGAAPATDTPA